MTDKINNYDHPQRYTGEDGKDLIDRFEEGLIPEEQARGFLKGNILKYVTRYEDKGRYGRFNQSKRVFKTADCI